MVEEKHIEWCRHMMRVLMEGGGWAVPRSALAFRKRGNTLVLISRMPHHSALPMSPAEWKEWQDGDYAATKEVFEAAGFKVIDESISPETKSGGDAGSVE
jgi:hypothetical protein